MKKFLIAAAAVAAVACIAAPASAQDAEVKGYGSIGVTAIGDDFVTLGAAQVRVGLRGEHFGIEAEGAIGIMDDSGIDLDHQFAGYLVGYLPASDNVDFIGRVGYGTFQVSAGGLSGDAQTVNVGAGLQWNADEHNGVRADFTYMFGDGDAYMAGLSYVRTF